MLNFNTLLTLYIQTPDLLPFKDSYDILRTKRISTLTEYDRNKIKVFESYSNHCFVRRYGM